MRQIAILFLVLVMVFTYSMSAKAELIDRGGGLVYDTDLDITWLQDANYAMTSGYDLDGLMTWTEATAWAEQLVFGGYDDWRLPKTLPVNGSTYIYPSQDFYDGSGDIGGYNISAPGSVYAGSKASEFSYFYYNSLKNLGAFDLNGNFNPNWSQVEVAPFSGVQLSKYWSGTDYDSLPGTAFSFNTDGGQNIDWKYEEHFVWAVRDGDVAEPMTITVYPYSEEYVIMVGSAYDWPAQNDTSSGKLFYIPINPDGTFGNVSYITDLGYRSGSGIADFDNDGDLDFVAGAIVERGPERAFANFYLFENDGDGNFVQQLIASGVDAGATSDNRVGTFAVADFNEDGYKDFVVPICKSDHVYLFNNNGNKNFTLTILTPLNDPSDAKEGDFNGDGHMDFVVTDYWNRQVYLYKGNGSGAFTVQFLIDVAGGHRATDITVGDFNEDGHLDIIVDDFTPHGGGTHLYTGNIENGNLNFVYMGIVYSRPLLVGSTSYDNVYGVDSFDFDRDGHKDLILSTYEYPPAGLVFIMRGKGDGTFWSAEQILTPPIGPLGSVFPVTPAEIPEDVTPPVLSLPNDMTVECAGPQGTVVSFVATAIDDIDGEVPVTCTPVSGSRFPLGATAVMCAASDNAGNTATGTFKIFVNDTTSPNITILTASPDVLWPPNHKMASVSLVTQVSDTCDPNPICEIVSINSNEPLNDLGDGDTSPDWEITGKLEVSLRAERSGNGSGRVYTITVMCSDTSGNSSSGAAMVTVPHDQGKKKDKK